MCLQELNAEYSEFGNSTIYQFGYSEESQAFRGFTYKSATNFNLEEYEYGAVYKPQPFGHFDVYATMEEHGIDDAFIKLMELQKAEDDLLDEKVGIGGEIHRLVLQKNSFKIEIIHKFPDYELQYKEMILSLNKNR